MSNGVGVDMKRKYLASFIFADNQKAGDFVSMVSAMPKSLSSGRWGTTVWVTSDIHNLLMAIVACAHEYQCTYLSLGETKSIKKLCTCGAPCAAHHRDKEEKISLKAFRKEVGK